MQSDSHSPATKPTEVTNTPPLVTEISPINRPTAGQLILQWLTYALWGWALLGLAALSFIVFFNFVDKADTSGALPYALAATLVLVPAAFVCDMFYRKQEPAKKQGFSAVIMVIHAVLFALFAIGSLVASVISLVQLTLNADANTANSSLAYALSWGSIAVLYSLTFLRTLNPWRGRRAFSLAHGLVMLGVTIAFVSFAITGPFLHSLATKNDRLIEQQLPEIIYQIESYAAANNKLPNTLADLNLTHDSQQLTDKNLIRYINETPTNETNDLRYQLCATYNEASTHSNIYSRPVPAEGRDGYNYGLPETRHDKGEVCYKLLATSRNAKHGVDVLIEKPAI